MTGDYIAIPSQSVCPRCDRRVRVFDQWLPDDDGVLIHVRCLEPHEVEEG